MEWFEAIIYLFLVIDCIVYAILTFTHGSLHKKAEKSLFLGKKIPFDPLMAVGYILLVAWLGFSLYRLGVFSW